MDSTENVGEVNDNSTDAEYVPDEDEVLDDSESEALTKPKSRKDPKKIVLSEYFKIDEDQKAARCRLCSEKIRFTTTDALKYHVLKVHDNERSVEDEAHIDGDDSDGDKEQNMENQSDQSAISKIKGGTSQYWQYFELVDDVKERAKCKRCGREFCFTSIGNLKKHLDNCDRRAAVLRKPPRKRVRAQYKRRSKLWRYFDCVDNMMKIATCRLCSNNFSYNCLSNLKKHLKSMHDGLAPSAGEEDDNEMKKVPRSAPCSKVRRKKFRSKIWKYFKSIDYTTKTASCLVCGNQLSYKCTSNLKTHLKTRHRREVSSGSEGDIEVLEEQSSAVWAYFKCLSEDLRLAACLICKKRVDYNDDHDLRKHLSKKHPQVYEDLESGAKMTKNLMITGDGDIYEIDEDVTKQEPEPTQEIHANDSDDWPYNNDETDVLDTTEHLDESIFNEPKCTPIKKRLQSYETIPVRQEKKQRLYIQNTPHQREIEESSLDIFAKYIVSLLKKLPSHKSDQLQADFIRQIMDAQNDTRISNSQSNRNTRSGIDDSHVTSNSEVRQVIIGNGDIQQLVLGNEHVIVTSDGDEIAVRKKEQK